MEQIKGKSDVLGIKFNEIQCGQLKLGIKNATKSRKYNPTNIKGTM
jgi:hypothetical protein